MNQNQTKFIVISLLLFWLPSPSRCYHTAEVAHASKRIGLARNDHVVQNHPKKGGFTSPKTTCTKKEVRQPLPTDPALVESVVHLLQALKTLLDSDSISELLNEDQVSKISNLAESTSSKTPKSLAKYIIENLQKNVPDFKKAYEGASQKKKEDLEDFLIDEFSTDPSHHKTKNLPESEVKEIIDTVFEMFNIDESPENTKAKPKSVKLILKFVSTG